MKQHYNTLILLLCLPALVFANDGKFKGKYTKEKTIKKEFTVNKDAGLTVMNSYGNIDIVTWNESRTVIEVTIRTNGNDESKVQSKLNEIKIDFTASASMVTAKTRFGETKSSWNSWWNSGNDNISMEVNYTIKMPITNSVDLDNDYGTISLNTLKGDARIDCDYGQLIIGELLGNNNYLSFDYTDKSTIEFMKNGKINADYSGFTLEKVGNLELIADYTRSEIGEANDINYNCDYGKVTIDKANNVIGRGDYVTNRLGTVTGEVNLNTDYGSIHIDRLTSTAKDVTIIADYTGVKIGFDSGYSFNCEFELRYASLKGKEILNLTTTSEKNSSKLYVGYHGNKNSGNTMNVRSSYGGVSLTKL